MKGPRRATHSFRADRVSKFLESPSRPRKHNSVGRDDLRYAGAHNDHLAEMTLSTRVRVSPYRRAQFRNLGRLAKSHVEHDRVVMAVLRGDRDGAAATMRAHIKIVSDEYWEYAKAV